MARYTLTLKLSFSIMEEGSRIKLSKAQLEMGFCLAFHVSFFRGE